MWLWLAIAAVAAITLALLVFPLLRRGAAPGERLAHDLAVYRDQLREVDIDLARGVLGEEEAAAARQEIERRILQSDARQDRVAITERSRRGVTAIALVVLVPVSALALYLGLGSPETPGYPLASREDAAPSTAEHDGGGELPDMVARLEQRLQNDPDDKAGWLLIGRSYMQMRRFTDAAVAFTRVMTLDAADVDAQVSLGEALTFAADGMVTPVAKAAFDAALLMRPGHPAARFYLGLAERQAGRAQTAYDRWLALAKESPPGAPWLGLLKQRLQDVGAELGIDVAAEWPAHLQRPESAAPRPAKGPSSEDVKSAMQMSSEDRMAFIRTMVGGLAARLQDEPNDFDGWMRLGRAYGVLGEQDNSKNAYAQAATLRPRDTGALAAHARAIVDAADADAPPPDDAIQAYRRLLSIEPTHSEALWFTGLADARGGNLKAAVAAWEALLQQLDPSTPQYKQLQEELARARKSLE